MNAVDRSFVAPDGRRIAYAEWGDAAGTPVLQFYAVAGAQQPGDRVVGIALACGLGEYIGDYPTSGMNAVAAASGVLADDRVRGAIVASFAEAFREGAAGPAHEVALITRCWDIDPPAVRQPHGKSTLSIGEFLTGQGWKAGELTRS